MADNKKLGIYAPWVIYSKKIEVLFEKDPDVTVKYDNDTHTISLYVENSKKANALSRLLPSAKVFGSVVLAIDVIPANNDNWQARYFRDAFEGNEAFSHLTEITEIPDVMISNPIAYCVFKKEVVQYGADDLSSENGVASTLYQDIAKEIFGETEGVYFCTATE